jgi:hypothetical protein
VDQRDDDQPPATELEVARLRGHDLSRGKKRTCGNVWIPRALCELSVEIDVLLWMLDDAFVGCGRGQP